MAPTILLALQMHDVAYPHSIPSEMDHFTEEKTEAVNHRVAIRGCWPCFQRDPPHAQFCSVVWGRVPVTPSMESTPPKAISSPPPTHTLGKGGLVLGFFRNVKSAVSTCSPSCFRRNCTMLCFTMTFCFLRTQRKRKEKKPRRDLHVVCGRKGAH